MGKPRSPTSTEGERKEIHRRLFTTGVAEVASSAAPSTRIRELLVPIDFSESSQSAIRRALLFAHQFRAHITLLHVMDMHLTGLPRRQINHLEKQIHEDAQRKLQNVLLSEIGRKATVTTMLSSGKTFEQIIQIAERFNVDLIVMAARSNRKFSRQLMGSTTDRVIRYAPCPVLVVRDQNAKRDAVRIR